MVGMAIWRGLQRFRWRAGAARQVQWSYLLVGLLLLLYMFIHGTLGAQLGAEFGVHNTAARILRDGGNPNAILKSV
jgi:uncharacterized membrane protein